MKKYKNKIVLCFTEKDFNYLRTKFQEWEMKELICVSQLEVRGKPKTGIITWIDRECEDPLLNEYFEGLERDGNTESQELKKVNE